MRSCFVLVLLLAVSLLASAQGKMVLRYDFAHSKGQVVKDATRNHYDARLCGSARLTNEGAVCLGADSGYVDMGPRIGKWLQAASQFTVVVRYKVDESVSIKGQGFFLWAFSTLASNTPTEGRYHAYKLNKQRGENSVGGWKNETTLEIGKAEESGRWMTIAYTQDGKKARLFKNGVLVAFTNEMFSISETFPSEAPIFNWLGRAPFSGDSFLLNTYISDVRIYDSALSEKEIMSLCENR